MKLLFLFVIVAGCFLTNSVVAVDEMPPPFKIATKRPTDKVEVLVEKGQAVFSIHSPAGISDAVIERTEEKWPDAMMLRLHLAGLENFRASNGRITLDAAVSSHADDPLRVRLWKDGKEDAPLESRSPLWMEIRMVGSGNNLGKGIPLKDGYFEMRLPAAFIEGNPKSITVSWIDFYRN